MSPREFVLTMGVLNLLTIGGLFMGWLLHSLRNRTPACEGCGSKLASKSDTLCLDCFERQG
jgi:hypothetical protein